MAWAFWRNEKSVVPTAIRTPDRPVRSLVTIPTTSARHLNIIKLMSYAYPLHYWFVGPKDDMGENIKKKVTVTVGNRTPVDQNQSP